MSPILVASCYGSAAAVSLYLLWHFGVQRWHWHAISILAALTLGLLRLPEPFTRPEMTLVVGWFFTVLFLWGVAAPVVAALNHPPDFHPRHHH